ncbi:MAG: hypothetical protein WAM11_04905 [Cyanobium sp.]
MLARLPANLWAVLVASLAALAWIPTLLQLAHPSDDQVWERFSLTMACQPQQFQLGWIGEAGPPQLLGALTGSLPAIAVQWISCKIALLSGLDPLQALLIPGLLLSFVLADLSCRLAGFGRVSSLATAFLITTAPCSLSRVGHLSLAMLWTVIPGLLACHTLWRSMASRGRPLPRLGSGALACLLCLPSQEYYVFFVLLLLASSFGLLLLLATLRSNRIETLAAIAARGSLFATGFLAVLLVLYAGKLAAVDLSSSQPPAFWSASRYASEQFQYGLLPFTWIIPPPWVALVRDGLENAGISTRSESFFWSTGSLLIPIAWIVAIRTIAGDPSDAPAATARGLGRSDLRFFALLLTLTTFVGLFWMTMGGAGTLVALLNPTLQSLNRFTAFEYGASVLLLTALLDRVISRRRIEPWPASGGPE